MTSVGERKQILAEVNRLAGRQLDAGWAAAQNASDFAAYMRAFYPELANTWYLTAADLSAVWYDEAAATSYSASAASAPSVERWQASLGWALSNSDALGLLAGSLQRTVFDGARDTTILNVEREPGARWARHASANACEFCRMLATRSAAYLSRDTAMQSHDNCHCLPVEVRPGGTYDPPDYVSKWADEYEAARKESGSSDPKRILAAWRQLDH